MSLYDALATPRSAEPTEPLPLRWPASFKQKLTVCANECAVPSLDGDLAGSLLIFERGDVELADSEIRAIFLRYQHQILADQSHFISFLHTLFVVQRMTSVSEFLRYYHKFPTSMIVRCNRPNRGPGFGRVRWTINHDRTHTFDFDAEAVQTEKSRMSIMAFHWEFPLISRYARSENVETGSLILNHSDLGLSPGLAYCDSRPDYFLVPDCVFVPSDGYSHVRKTFNAKRTEWSERKPVALWRGATTGIPSRLNDWESLERVKLCKIAASSGSDGLIDAGLSNVTQFDDPRVIKEIETSMYFKGSMDWSLWTDYKYQVDIDGNANAWSGLFQRLLTGSVVLKVESYRGLRQWFYDDLKPWANYVPVAPDLWDLVDKIKWLTKNDQRAFEIGVNGRQLAERLSLERELERAIPIISSAFRYFN